MIWNPTTMSTPEAAFAARVRDGLRPLGVDTERIENRVNLGVSDMLVGAGDRFVSIELKAVSRGLKVSLRPHQIAFLTRHASHGRPCYVLVHQISTVVRPGRIALYHGRQALELAEQGLRLEPLAAWPNRGMPWEELAIILSGKLPIK
jgi:Holliday junction resolvase